MTGDEIVENETIDSSQPISDKYDPIENAEILVKQEIFQYVLPQLYTLNFTINNFCQRTCCEIASTLKVIEEIIFY